MYLFLTNQLLDCLKCPDWSDVAADGVYVILNEYDGIMTSAVHANVKIMYRQRFFHTILPRLISQFTTAETGNLQ